MKAIVVGGGIGGLSAAIALRRAGVEAVVFERAAELTAAGAGVTLWANAVRCLKRLGVYEAVRETGAEIGGGIRTHRGRLLARIPAETVRARLGDASLAVHRADLQAALLSALPEDAVHLGANFTGFEGRGGRVAVRFADGSEEGDLLVGADGLRSAVRARLHGMEPPRYAGFTAWRGIAPVSVGGGNAVNLWGRGSEFGLADIGRGRAYWYLTKNAPEGQVDAPEGRKAEVLGHLEGWYEPAREAVGATEEAGILRTDIYDRDPLGPRWGEGRVTLLGDAAHPMTPNLGQGACQALEDAIVLSEALGQSGSVVAALRLYEARRTGRAARVVRLSRRMGRAYQAENPLMCGLRDALAGAMPARAQLRQLESVVGGRG